MKKHLRLLTLLICFGLTIAFGQEKQTSNKLIEEAMQFYNSKDYVTSAEKFEKAFLISGDKINILYYYVAACSNALAQNPDTAFQQLFKIVKDPYFEHPEDIMTNADLEILHQDERWNKLGELIKITKKRKEALYDKPLMAMLATISNDDQKYREELDVIIEKYGWDSDESKALVNKLEEQDALNLKKVTKILDERGWLGPDVIGLDGNMTLFLVIQHSDHETQEKYLPMMRDAVAKGNAIASNLALLEDRVALANGEKQIYGSQLKTNPITGINYVYPMIDPDHVNERRSAMGLGTIEAYVAMFNITWDVQAYKKSLLEREAPSEN
ncbi:hypothetical protein SAMN05216480_1217 [Pustulibacterium marinum]|uniref:Tetratricopeptide repeat-containing protein n=1 Tax=Pustulibacterium marinum TaxID=1224947 RepID=A0A1I7ISJ9_9FLAO|nr:DUF6624 domain-containing protein [Pustulibacterium marinum]SFU75877.1 hypothetical protein SAMN05216480_1217 [Pustulibacterium marinum]